MNHLKKIWKISGSLKKRDYLKIMSFINAMIVLFLIVYMSIEEISAISPAFNYLHEPDARKFLITRISYLIIVFIFGIAYLFLNFRFYPFVETWIVNSLFRKPRISQSISRAKRDYQKSYNENPNGLTTITVKNRVEKDWFGNAKWEKNFSGNIKTDRSGIPIPKVTSEITQKDVGNSRSFNGTREAYEGLAASGFSYVLKMFVSLLLFLLSWYFSFILGWVAASKYIQ